MRGNPRWHVSSRHGAFSSAFTVHLLWNIVDCSRQPRYPSNCKFSKTYLSPKGLAEGAGRQAPLPCSFSRNRRLRKTRIRNHQQLPRTTTATLGMSFTPPRVFREKPKLDNPTQTGWPVVKLQLLCSQHESKRRNFIHEIWMMHLSSSDERS